LKLHFIRPSWVSHDDRAAKLILLCLSLGSSFLQAKTAIQVQNPTLAPISYTELSRIRREEKERSVKCRLHGSFHFNREGRPFAHDSLGR
jgi:hypothetical protein